MTATDLSFPARPAPARSLWRDCLQPKEHGSWSLAFEPVVLGLLCAPSPAGGFLAVAVAAGFLARRPLRLAVCDASPARRASALTALAGCALVALAAVAGAIAVAGLDWLPWLLPAALGAACFAAYDLRGDGREASAELAGAAAFAWLPAVFLALAGRGAGDALAVAAVMSARAVPTVMFVRAAVRGRKSGRFNFVPALIATGLSGTVVLILACLRLVPFVSVAFAGLFLVRILFVRARPATRPKTLGQIEAILGAAFVVTLGLAW